MNWYYLNDGKSVGPLSPEAMMELRCCGLIADDTRVRREDGAGWAEYAEAFRGAASSRKTGVSALAGTTWSRMADGVSSAAGLEKLEGREARRMVGGLFKKRTLEDIEDSFAAGTRASTPSLDQVNTDWPAPWVFLRLLVFSVVCTLGFYWAINRFQNPLLYPGWLFMGAFAIPFSVMYFFMETNVLRNISFYRVLKLLFLGGLLSLIFSMALFESTSAHTWFGAMAAGPVEELAKILAVVLVARNWKDRHWTLNGMLLGAAVGAGFAAFETAGYIFVYALLGGAEADLMILRASCSPCTHIIWSAAAAGALWRFKGSRDFEIGMLKEWPVLRILLFVMALHALWNSPLTIPLLSGFPAMAAKFLILGLIGWMLVLLLIQSGLNQVKQARAESGADAREIPPAAVSS